MAGAIRGQQLARLLGPWRVETTPEYQSLAVAVRGLVTDGRLALALRLPAERELAAALGVSRTTVTAAYRQLRGSGHLVSRRGAGSWTALPQGHRVRLSGLAPVASGAGGLDLAVAAMPAPEQLDEAVAEAAEALRGYTAGAGYEPMGLLELRERVADEYTRRGLPTDPSQILITSGVQHAVDLLLRLLVEPGSRVLVEIPTYPNVLAAITAARARIVTYGLGGGGWDPDLLAATLRGARARLAYLSADFQNPAGHLMDASTRQRLAAAAQVAGTDVIVDESLVDLHLSGPEVPSPVAAFDRAARVISVGGMSKTYWGGLRIGWIRAAAPVIARLAAARLSIDIASPVLDQLVATRLLEHRSAVVAMRRDQLLARRDALVAALAERLPGWQWSVPGGGVNLWVELDAPVATALARRAEQLGLRVVPGPRFGVDGTMERFLRLPYTLPEPDLAEAVHRLAAARQDLETGARLVWERPAVVA